MTTLASGVQQPINTVGMPILAMPPTKTADLPRSPKRPTAPAGCRDKFRDRIIILTVLEGELICELHNRLCLGPV
jgi:hypothetical protein